MLYVAHDGEGAARRIDLLGAVVFPERFRNACHGARPRTRRPGLAAHPAEDVSNTEVMEDRIAYCVVRTA